MSMGLNESLMVRIDNISMSNANGMNAGNEHPNIDVDGDLFCHH